MVEVGILSLIHLKLYTDRDVMHRYNTFLVLYPIGVASETWLIYRAIPPASKMDEKFGYALWAVLASYVPGFYVLFTYMLAQRRRVLRAWKAEKKKA